MKIKTISLLLILVLLLSLAPGTYAEDRGLTPTVEPASNPTSRQVYLPLVSSCYSVSEFPPCNGYEDQEPTATPVVLPTKVVTVVVTATSQPVATSTLQPDPTATTKPADPTPTEVGGQVDPTATNTAAAPTATETATNTPEPTATETATVEPTSTSTPGPTATETATVEPTSTSTPEPTATETATSTPEPTATETATPEPTATATATSTPVPCSASVVNGTFTSNLLGWSSTGNVVQAAGRALFNTLASTPNGTLAQIVSELAGAPCTLSYQVGSIGTPAANAQVEVQIVDSTWEIIIAQQTTGTGSQSISFIAQGPFRVVFVDKSVTPLLVDMTVDNVSLSQTP